MASLNFSVEFYRFCEFVYVFRKDNHCVGKITNFRLACNCFIQWNEVSGDTIITFMKTLTFSNVFMLRILKMKKQN